MQMNRWLLCVAAFLFLLPMMCTSVAHAGSPAANFFVAAEGRAAYDAALRAHFGACDAAEARRVEALLVPLAAAAQMDVPLVVISSSGKPNLYALPGAVVVNRGMLALVPDDGELSVLLAHELGHLALDHPMRGIHRSIRAQHFLRRAERCAAAWQKESAAAPPEDATAQAAFDGKGEDRPSPAAAKALFDGADAFVQAALHAELGIADERAADRWAAALLPRAGIAPATAVRLWDHLKAAGVSDRSHTHPSYAERKEIYCAPHGSPSGGAGARQGD